MAVIRVACTVGSGSGIFWRWPRLAVLSPVVAEARASAEIGSGYGVVGVTTSAVRRFDVSYSRARVSLIHVDAAVNSRPSAS